jgi:hypothetical protein
MEDNVMSDKTIKLVATPEDVVPPISVGNPLTAADFAIDQSHLEEYTSDEEGPPDVTCAKPPKGTFLTVRAETTAIWQDRRCYFLLELKDRDPYLVLPHIAKLKKEEDVIRPVLMVRYVTMAGEEGLWALKMDPPDRKANAWNRSAMTALKVAEEGHWVRLMTAKGRYSHGFEEDLRADAAPLFRPHLRRPDRACIQGSNDRRPRSRNLGLSG